MILLRLHALARLTRAEASIAAVPVTSRQARLRPPIGPMETSSNRRCERFVRRTVVGEVDGEAVVIRCACEDETWRPASVIRLERGVNPVLGSPQVQGPTLGRLSDPVERDERGF